MCTENQVLVKTNIYKWVSVKKTVHEVETHWLSGKKYFWVKQSVKRSCWQSSDNQIHHYWFSWKSCNSKQCILLPTTLTKFSLFIEWSSVAHLYMSSFNFEIKSLELLSWYFFVIHWIYYLTLFFVIFFTKPISV